MAYGVPNRNVEKYVFSAVHKSYVCKNKLGLLTNIKSRLFWITGRKEWPNWCPSTKDSFLPFHKSDPQTKSQKENSIVRYIDKPAKTLRDLAFSRRAACDWQLHQPQPISTVNSGNDRTEESISRHLLESSIETLLENKRSELHQIWTFKTRSTKSILKIQIGTDF